jgi:IS605 OrfB family transposase
MNTEKHVYTLETRLPVDTDKVNLSYLDDYAACFSQLSRVFFASWSKNQFSSTGQPNKPSFMRIHGITGRQFNAIKRSVEGMVESQLTSLDNYLIENQHRKSGLIKRIEKKKALLIKQQGKAKNMCLSSKQRELAQKHANIHMMAMSQMHRRKQILVSREASLNHQIETKQLSVCFGSKKQFRAQHYLHENGYRSHHAWRKDWQASRSAQFFVLGSSDESGGCQGCTLEKDGEGFRLRLLLPESIQKGHGKYVYLTDLHFPYQRHLVDQVLANQVLRQADAKQYDKLKKANELPLITVKEKDKKTGEYLDVTRPVKPAEYTSIDPVAMSYRFIKDDKGWRVLVSFSVTKPAQSADVSQGMIGIDFNAGFLSVVQINSKGQPVKRADLRFNDKINATSRQNKTQLQLLAKSVVEQAINTGLPIAIEQLSFQKKKGSMQKGQQSGYNRMLSALSYRAFRDAIERRCFKEGVALINVNPAYTSFIGRLKYAASMQFNVHQSAALVIGRRAMQFAEEIPEKCTIKLPKGMFSTFCAPADAQNDPNSLKKLHGYFSKWLTKEMERRRFIRENPDKLSCLIDVPF